MTLGTIGLSATQHPMVADLYAPHLKYVLELRRVVHVDLQEEESGTFPGSPVEHIQLRVQIFN